MAERLAAKLAPPNPPGLSRRSSLVRAREQAIRLILLACAMASILTTVGIIYVLVTETLIAVPPNEAFFQLVSPWQFFTETRWTPQFSDRHFGILPLLCGTFLVAGIAALIGLPIGLAGSIYLSEYASPRTRNKVKPMSNEGCGAGVKKAPDPSKTKSSRARSLDRRRAVRRLSWGKTR